jgi:hypothetical protein
MTVLSISAGFFMSEKGGSKCDYLFPAFPVPFASKRNQESKKNSIKQQEVISERDFFLTENRNESLKGLWV